MRCLNAALLVSLLCAGCASSPPPGSVQLNTLITNDGLKLFELTLPRITQHMEIPTSSSKPKKPVPPLSESRVLTMVNSALEESRYCRAGYVLLGRYAGETTGRVRGECKDRATDEDRQRYPDTIARW